MKFMRDCRHLADFDGDVDPMNGVGNLFDTAVVFIAALLLALLTVFDAKEIFSRDADLTIVKQSSSGVTIVEKRGKKIHAVMMTREEAAGRGTRLGTAYRLEDGSMIYVPED